MPDDICAQCRRGHHADCGRPGLCACPTCGAEAVDWREPPRRRGRRNRPIVDEETMAQLRANPKRWACVGQFTGASSASSARSRLKKDLGHPECDRWEITSVRGSEGGSELFVRFLG